MSDEYAPSTPGLMSAIRARNLARHYKGLADTLRQDGYRREAEMAERDSMHRIIEPTIVINGVTLTTGEALTLRVALENWTMQLRDDPGCLGVDEPARRLRDAYLAALGRIHQAIARSQVNEL